MFVDECVKVASVVDLLPVAGRDFHHWVSRGVYGLSDEKVHQSFFFGEDSMEICTQMRNNTYVYDV